MTTVSQQHSLGCDVEKAERFTTRFKKALKPWYNPAAKILFRQHQREQVDGRHAHRTIVDPRDTEKKRWLTKMDHLRSRMKPPAEEKSKRSDEFGIPVEKIARWDIAFAFNLTGPKQSRRFTIPKKDDAA